MQLDPINYIKFSVIKHQFVSLTVKDSGIFTVVKKNPPSDFRKHKLTNFASDIIQLSAELGTLYLSYEDGIFYNYESSSSVSIINHKIHFVKFNNRGTPILNINGEEVSGLKQISISIFGYSHRNIREIIQPYIDNQMDITKILLKGNKTFRGKTYPVFSYCGREIKGVSNLRKEFPQLTEQDIRKLRKPSAAPLKRHEQLIKSFDIELNGNMYSVADPVSKVEQMFTSKKGLMEYIKTHPQGGSLSREVAKQLFESL